MWEGFGLVVGRTGISVLFVVFYFFPILTELINTKWGRDALCLSWVLHWAGEWIKGLYNINASIMT